MHQQGRLWGQDPERERNARDRGMAFAAGKNHEALAAVGELAKRIARREGVVDINMVRAEVEQLGWKITWGAWTGSVFKGAEWVPVGYTSANHKGGHRRLVRRWRLV